MEGTGLGLGAGDVHANRHPITCPADSHRHTYTSPDTNAFGHNQAAGHDRVATLADTAAESNACAASHNRLNKDL